MMIGSTRLRFFLGAASGSTGLTVRAVSWKCSAELSGGIAPSAPDRTIPWPGVAGSSTPCIEGSGSRGPRPGGVDGG